MIFPKCFDLYAHFQEGLPGPISINVKSGALLGCVTCNGNKPPQCFPYLSFDLRDGELHETPFVKLNLQQKLL